MSDFMELLKQFSKACQTHDWFYQYSDDHRVWKKGHSQRASINSLHTQLKEHGLGDKATEIFEKYRPKGC
jgi:hypothetical protein